MDIPTLQAELSRIHWMQREAEKSLGEQSSIQDMMKYYRLMKTLLRGFQAQVDELYGFYAIMLGGVLVEQNMLKAELDGVFPEEED